MNWEERLCERYPAAPLVAYCVGSLLAIPVTIIILKVFFK